MFLGRNGRISVTVSEDFSEVARSNDLRWSKGCILTGAAWALCKIPKGFSLYLWAGLLLSRALSMLGAGTRASHQTRCCHDLGKITLNKV